MKVTTRTRYGTRAMVQLALNYGQGLITSKDIADEQEVSPKYLEQLLATLRRDGLVRSVRGARGGHTLARSPDEITLRDIFESLEGSDGLVECTASPDVCDRASRCPTRSVWAEMYAACLRILEGTTLGALAGRTR
jgi:Rrf2 family cysteine metabolism transcriptional repressor